MIAGGRSSRFGSDKRVAEFRGAPLIDHAIAALETMVDRVVIVGQGWRDRPGVADRPAAGLGPLGGIAGALGWAADHGYASVVTIGCDMPEVPATLVQTVVATLPCWCTDAPVLGHWPSAWGAPLAVYLATDGDRAVRRWAARMGAAAISAPCKLHNVNTPADLPA